MTAFKTARDYQKRTWSKFQNVIRKNAVATVLLLATLRKLQWGSYELEGPASSSELEGSRLSNRFSPKTRRWVKREAVGVKIPIGAKSSKSGSNHSNVESTDAPLVTESDHGDDKFKPALSLIVNQRARSLSTRSSEHSQNLNFSGAGTPSLNHTIANRRSQSSQSSRLSSDELFRLDEDEDLTTDRTSGTIDKDSVTVNWAQIYEAEKFSEGAYVDFNQDVKGRTFQCPKDSVEEDIFLEEYGIRQVREYRAKADHKNPKAAQESRLHVNSRLQFLITEVCDHKLKNGIQDFTVLGLGTRHYILGINQKRKEDSNEESNEENNQNSRDEWTSNPADTNDNVNEWSSKSPRFQRGMIVFRGTEDAADFGTNLKFFEQGIGPDDEQIWVHRGFFNQASEVYQDLVALSSASDRHFSSGHLNSLFGSITITGHSLGGAAATVARLLFNCKPEVLGMAKFMASVTDKECWNLGYDGKLDLVTFGAPSAILQEPWKILLEEAEGVDQKQYVQRIQKLTGADCEGMNGSASSGFNGSGPSGDANHAVSSTSSRSTRSTASSSSDSRSDRLSEMSSISGSCKSQSRFLNVLHETDPIPRICFSSYPIPRLGRYATTIFPKLKFSESRSFMHLNEEVTNGRFAALVLHDSEPPVTVSVTAEKQETPESIGQKPTKWLAIKWLGWRPAMEDLVPTHLTGSYERALKALIGGANRGRSQVLPFAKRAQPVLPLRRVKSKIQSRNY